MRLLAAAAFAIVLVGAPGLAHGVTVGCLDLPDGTPCDTECSNGGKCRNHDCVGGRPAPDGTLCATGNPCTSDDTCQQGHCLAGLPLPCPAAPCWVGTCVPYTGCVYSRVCRDGGVDADFDMAPPPVLDGATADASDGGDAGQAGDAGDAGAKVELPDADLEPFPGDAAVPNLDGGAPPDPFDAGPDAAMVLPPEDAGVDVDASIGAPVDAAVAAPVDAAVDPTPDLALLSSADLSGASGPGPDLLASPTDLVSLPVDFAIGPLQGAPDLSNTDPPPPRDLAGVAMDAARAMNDLSVRDAGVDGGLPGSHDAGSDAAVSPADAALSDVGDAGAGVGEGDREDGGEVPGYWNVRGSGCGVAPTMRPSTRSSMRSGAGDVIGFALLLGAVTFSRSRSRRRR